MSSGGRDSGLACQCLGQGLAQQGHYINICGKRVSKGYTTLPTLVPEPACAFIPPEAGGSVPIFHVAVQSVDSAAFWKILSFPGHSRINSV